MMNLFAESMMERDKFMDPETAKSLGLIDTVLVSPPKVGKEELDSKAPSEEK